MIYATLIENPNVDRDDLDRGLGLIEEDEFDLPEDMPEHGSVAGGGMLLQMGDRIAVA